MSQLPCDAANVSQSLNSQLTHGQAIRSSLRRIGSFLLLSGLLLAGLLLLMAHGTETQAEATFESSFGTWRAPSDNSLERKAWDWNRTRAWRSCFAEHLRCEELRGFAKAVGLLATLFGTASILSGLLAVSFVQRRRRFFSQLTYILPAVLVLSVVSTYVKYLANEPFSPVSHVCSESPSAAQRLGILERVGVAKPAEFSLGKTRFTISDVWVEARCRTGHRLVWIPVRDSFNDFNICLRLAAGGELPGFTYRVVFDRSIKEYMRTDDFECKKKDAEALCAGTLPSIPQGAIPVRFVAIDYSEVPVTIELESP